MSRSASEVGSTDGGFARLYRRVYDHPVFRDHGEASVFIWLFANAAWRPTRVAVRGGTRMLEVGDVIASMREISEAFHMDKNIVSRLMQRLVAHGMVSIKSGHSSGQYGRIVTIVNYQTYQNVAGCPLDEPGADRVTDRVTAGSLPGHYRVTDPQIDELKQGVKTPEEREEGKKES